MNRKNVKLHPALNPEATLTGPRAKREVGPEHEVEIFSTTSFGGILVWVFDADNYGVLGAVTLTPPVVPRLEEGETNP